MFTDDETIRITKNGQWLSNGDEITHERTLSAYKRHIGRDAEGYFIEIGSSFKRIEVEDTPFFIDLAWVDENKKIRCRVTNGFEIEIDPAFLTLSKDRLTYPLHSFIPGIPEDAKFLPQPYHWLLCNLSDEVLNQLLVKSGEIENQ